MDYIEYEIPTGDQLKSITHRQTRAENENTIWQGGGSESMKTTISGDTKPDQCTAKPANTVTKCATHACL